MGELKFPLYFSEREIFVTSFNDLGLIEPILKAIGNEGYQKPTPIQSEALPPLLAGRDLLGCAQTGTGKTAAFALPILQSLYKSKTVGKPVIRALILTPTRELAAQIAESFTGYGKYTGLRNVVIFGGVSQRPQEAALRKGADILIATPGRLIDLINQKIVKLSDISFFVLDEADRMLDMGFFPDVKRVISKIPKERQTMLFSATMPKEIAHLADSILNDPVKVAVTPVSSPVDAISQKIYFVEKRNKRSLLLYLMKDLSAPSVLVFTKTKHGANRVCKELLAGGVSADAIHGDKSQNARQSALTKFKKRQIKVLVATDIAARGIDISDLPYVINFDLPDVPETYVHRIGRTGRAGREGIALSFCDSEERFLLKDIEKLIGREIEPAEDYPFKADFGELAKPQKNNFTGYGSYKGGARSKKRRNSGMPPATTEQKQQDSQNSSRKGAVVLYKSYK